MSKKQKEIETRNPGSLAKAQPEKQDQKDKSGQEAMQSALSASISETRKSV